jgi:three-Cys-motif partner protein
VPSTRWRLEPHSAAKHQILRHYLNAWFPILGSQHERVVFLDGFAGPGIYDHGEPGSPIIALRTLLEHSFFPRMACQFEFFFLENRQKRYDSLVEQLEAFTRARGGLPRNVTVVHQQTTFEEAASGLVDDLRQQRARLAPTFAFIDPFGFKGAPIELVGRLLAFDRCEVFFHFMYNRVNQFLAAERITAHLDGLFGTRAYIQACELDTGARKRFLHDLYKRQLHDVGGFAYVRSFEMVTREGHISFLFYGTRSLKGLRAMKDAMWKVDVGGGTRFSDRLAGQEVLLAGDAVDVGPLRTAMLHRFAGHRTTVDQVEEFVLADTPYAASHYKRQVLRPLEETGRVEILSPRGRRFTYPEGTVLRFAPEQLGFLA